MKERIKNKDRFFILCSQWGSSALGASPFFEGPSSLMWLSKKTDQADETPTSTGAPKSCIMAMSRLEMDLTVPAEMASDIMSEVTFTW